MKFRSTAILLVIFVLLAGYVFIFERNKKEPETPTDKSTWVLTLSKDDVQQISVTDQGQTVLLARSEGTWYVGGVGGQPADATRVDSIITSLVDLRSARVLTQPVESLAAFGLETPPMTVTLGLSNNQQEVLYIGNKNPQGSQYYLQRAGHTPIHLIYSYLVDDLKRLVSQPPYQPTPTPTVETQVTPTAEATPAPATVPPAGTPKP